VTPSTLRVTLHVAWLAWRRLANRFQRRGAALPKPGQRAATARKRAPGKLLLGFMAVAFCFQGITVTTQLVTRAARAIEQTALPDAFFVSESTFSLLSELARQGSCEGPNVGPVAGELEDALRSETRPLMDEAKREERYQAYARRYHERCADGFRASRIPNVFWPDRALWYRGPDALRLPNALAFAALLLGLAVAFQTVAGTGNDLTSVDTRLEFLFAFPVRARALFAARIFAIALTLPTLWIFLLPFYGVIFYCAGFGPLAPLLGLAATLYVGVLAGSARVLTESVLPRLFSPLTVARIQAGLLVASYVGMILAMGYAFRASRDDALVRWLTLPRWVVYGPLTAPLTLAAGGRHAVLGLLLTATFAAAAVLVSVLVAERSVRNGFMVSSNADQARRERVQAGAASHAPWLGAGAAKELKALFRDRQLRMQAFVTPVVLVFVQLWLNPSLLPSIGSNPSHVAAAAFATSMFTLATGACSLLATEGGALWILYTGPVRLERVLLSKLKVWVGVASGFAVLVLGGMWIRTPALLVGTLVYVPQVFIGVVLYAVIALGIGALGTDPLEAEPRRRVRPGAVYLFMLLATLYGAALVSDSWWRKLVELMLSLLLAYALWQKLRDHLPYLLDPTEAPPPALAVADGVIAAFGFLVCQSLFFWLFEDARSSLARNATVAFAASGASVAGLSLWYFQRARLPELWTTLGLRRPPRANATLGAIGAGVLGGLGAATFGLGYLKVVHAVPFLRELFENAEGQPLFESRSVWLLALVVLAAPLFEEFIFRGILFSGFRRSLGVTGAAFASAAVFALVHPPGSFPPVFLFGLLAALLYSRFRWLGAPIAAHAVYNAIVLGAQLGFR
jgi:membrane protease YdiL (CAAX protease family)